jgi:hypothetical protein
VTVHTTLRDGANDPLLTLGFRHGWCTLTVSDLDGNVVTLKATTLRDAFADLLHAVLALLDGSPCQSVPWMGEGRGWFIDMYAAADDALGVAVHGMRDPDALLLGRPWVPVRAGVELETVTSLRSFAIALAHLTRQVELDDADATGLIPHWGFKIPRIAFAELERRTTPWGYRPRSSDEYAERRRDR